MRRFFVLFLVCAMALVGTSSVFAGKKNAGMPGGVIANVIAFEATVEGIDYWKRSIPLKGPEGKMKTLTVSKEIKNFDQIKKGDTVKAEYLEEVAVFVRKASEPPDAAEASMVGVAPKGKKPGIVDVNRVRSRQTSRPSTTRNGL